MSLKTYEIPKSSCYGLHRSLGAAQIWRQDLLTEKTNPFLFIAPSVIIWQTTPFPQHHPSSVCKPPLLLNYSLPLHCTKKTCYYCSNVQYYVARDLVFYGGSYRIRGYTRKYFPLSTWSIAFVKWIERRIFFVKVFREVSTMHLRIEKWCVCVCLFRKECQIFSPFLVSRDDITIYEIVREARMVLAAAKRVLKEVEIWLYWEIWEQKKF